MKGMLRGAAIVAALTLVFLASQDVKAGNVSLSSPTYFSVELSDGQYLYHTNSSKVLLIDDLTYSCDYQPCDAAEACDFFLPDDMPPFENEPWEYIHMPAFENTGLPDGMVVSAFTSHGSGGGVFNRVSGLAARHTFSEVGMKDSTDGSDGDWFDRFSFSTYGQLGWTETKEQRWFESWQMVEEIAFMGIRGGVGVGVGGAGGMGVGVGVGVGVGLYSTPSSASRHYQTPHIVQNGRVYFLVTNPYMMTIGGKVYVKGRVVDSSSAPTVDTGISFGSSS